MGRAPCCDKLGLKKGPWTPEEDQKLIAYIQQHGHGSWKVLPKNAGLLRCGKSCRLRWTNYLRPDIKRGRFSLDEEQLIIQRHAVLGNRWSAISAYLPGRTDNEIKNYWNTHLKKRLLQMGMDAATRHPNVDLLDPSFVAKPKLSSTLSHMAQWENARLEAEARLAREYLQLASCRQRGGSGLLQAVADGGRAWTGEQLWQTRRSGWDQSPAIPGHALSFPNFSPEDHGFSFPSPGNDVISLSLPFDDSDHHSLVSESLSLRGVPKLEHYLSPPPPCRSFESIDDQRTADDSLETEPLLQQTERLLRMREKLSADQTERPHEKASSSAISGASAFPDVSALNSAPGSFWPGDEIHPSPSPPPSPSPSLPPPPALSFTDDLLSQDTDPSISYGGSISFPSALQLPAELLLDLPSLQPPAKAASCGGAAVSDQPDLSSFSQQTPLLQSKDYWSSMLKLVGSPVLG